MLDIAFIRQNADVVRSAVTNKRLDLDVDALLSADKVRREAVAQLDEKRARKNALSGLIPKAAPEERAKLVAEAKDVRAEIERLEPALTEANKTFESLMLRVPSIPRPEVPIGRGEEDNVEVRKVGTPRSFDFEPKDHIELMASLGLVDLDGPRRFSGGRAYALIRNGALLELAVTRLAVDILVARGLDIVLPPVLVRERAMTGTGFFPLGREEAYGITADELFLVGTSSSPSTPTRRSTRRACPSATPDSPRASGEKLVRTEKTHEASIGCTSSPRSSKSCSVSRTRRWPRKSTTRSSPMPKRFWKHSRSRTGSRSLARARSAWDKRASTKSSRGCQDAGPTPRRTRARPWGISRRGDPTSDSEWRTARSDILTR
jgi:hypothetical protein